MNTKQWIDDKFENLGPKVVCLILAILLYVFNQVSSFDKKAVTVPLTVESKGLMMPYSDVPKYVKVYVRAAPEVMARINSSSFTAVLNLDNFTEAGHYSVPVKLTEAENLLSVDSLEAVVHPEEISVDLDEKVLRYVPVKAVYSGEVSHGYEISAVDINPATVKVAGPSKILEKVKHIYTKKVNVNGASISLSQEVKLDNLNPKLDVMPDSDFKVTVTITPAQGERKLEGIVPAVSGLSENLEIADKIPAVSLKVSGLVPVLDAYEPAENSVFIDLSRISEPGNYDVPVTVNLPENIALDEISKENVTISVAFRVVESESENGGENQKAAGEGNADQNNSSALEQEKTAQ